MKTNVKRLCDFAFRPVKSFASRRPKTAVVLLFAFIWFLCCLPSPLFKVPYCFVMDDSKGDLLGARIAADGQWRFPPKQFVPEKFQRAIIEFEDRRFFWHFGIDPLGILRAIRQNVAKRSIVSGGSTLSMQVIRLARNKTERGFFSKAVEAIMSVRMELTYSKKEILKLYATHAPFGGNVVGLDAASWRYYGKTPEMLSWAEAATLAVLPNSPALIHPGRNRSALLAKRNRLLQRLFERGRFDEITLQLALEEPLPAAPLPLPDLAPHLLERAKKEQPNVGRVTATLDKPLQEKIINIVGKHQHYLAQNGIHNAAAMILDVETGEVLAYVGNVVGAGDEHGDKVDIIPAPRSTGSILKPFLYSMALDDGLVLPKSLVSDVPMQMGGYRPENYKQTFDGSIALDRALVRSLNIPMIRILQQYGIEKFHHNLKKWGMTTLSFPPDHYGLPLVLGGAEGSLWDVTGIYASMARVLEHYYPYEGSYDVQDFHPPKYIKNDKKNRFTKKPLQKQPPFVSASACHLAFEAMQQVERPDDENNWEVFRSNKRIAWKTGTSFGFRDAWAVGVTPNYAVGVWVGNADGEGRPDLVGVLAAAPLLFDVFALLETPRWFYQPYDEMKKLPICRYSGYRALDHCTAIDTAWVAPTGVKVKACPYCVVVHTDREKKWQLNSTCATSTEMAHHAWFVLPPLEEYYYKNKHPEYVQLPPFRADCQVEVSSQNDNREMDLAYPKNGAKIYVPVGFDGKRSRTVFRATHRRPNSTIYWHLDDTYIGKTENFHELALDPSEGKHTLTIIDQQGARAKAVIEIIAKK